MKRIINTERLIINEATEEDTEFFNRLLNSPTWLEFIGDRGVKTNEQALHYIQSNLIKSYTDNGYGLYTISIKKTLDLIGVCGFLKRDYLENPDIGFALLPDYAGKGYMLEATLAIIEYGKTQLGLDYLLAITTHNNTKSCNLLKKVGFETIGTINPKNGKEDFLLFSNKKGHST